MKLPLISAGELFELLRPAAFVLSAGLSIWVLASARRRRFNLYASLTWALGTFFLPFVVLPVYLIVLIYRRRTRLVPRSTDPSAQAPAEPQLLPIRRRFLLPAVYGVLLLGATGVYLYRDYRSVDAHLARATQAKLSSQPAKTIREYRAALALEENPHTHKLLAEELADARQWSEALNEFQLAEQGGEADELLPFKIAQVMLERGDHSGSVREYQRFLSGKACQQSLPDYRCEIARIGVGEGSR